MTRRMVSTQVSSKVPRDVVRLLRQEAATIDYLVRAGSLSEAAGRRQVVRLARQLARGPR